MEPKSVSIDSQPRLMEALDRAKLEGRHYTWRPVIGVEVEVIIADGKVSALDGTFLGDVFRDSNPIWGWRWRRAGVNETRGGGLGTETQAVSDLLFNLRRSGKV